MSKQPNNSVPAAKGKISTFVGKVAIELTKTAVVGLLIAATVPFLEDFDRQTGYGNKYGGPEYPFQISRVSGNNSDGCILVYTPSGLPVNLPNATKARKWVPCP